MHNTGFERVGRCLSVEDGLSPSHPASLGAVDIPPTIPDQSDRAVSVGLELQSTKCKVQDRSDRAVSVGWNSRIQDAKYRISAGYRLFTHRTSHNERSDRAVSVGLETRTQNAERRI